MNNPRRATDETLDWLAQNANLLPMMPTFNRIIPAMAIELRECRNAEQFNTYRLASGEDLDAGWWDTPDMFEEADWEERTEVFHETWGLITRESIWYGTDSNDDEDEHTMTNDECKCGANDGSTDGYHTKADHRSDCGRTYGTEACGGKETPR